MGVSVLSPLPFPRFPRGPRTLPTVVRLVDRPFLAFLNLFIVPFYYLPFLCPRLTLSTLFCHRVLALEPIAKVSFIDNEPDFRWTLLQDQMAFDKLHEGVKKFAEDGDTLKAILRKKLEA